MFSLIRAGRGSRRCFVAAGVLLAVGTWASRASADAFTFVNTLHNTSYAPSGSETVTLNDPTQNVSTGAYSDILVWTDNSSPATAPLSSGETFETYCIDINHDIGAGGNYTLNVGGLSSDSSLNANQILAINYLFGSNNSGLRPVSPPGTNNSIGGDLAGTTNQTDANFQSALWAVIYDYSPLEGSQPASLASGLPLTLTGGIQESTVAKMAWDAVQDAQGNVQAGDSTSPAPLDAMYLVNNDTGQQQVFIKTSNAPATPLPQAYTGGLVLFGLVGVVARSRRNKALQAV